LTRHLGCDVTMAGRGESRLTMAGQFGARILNCDLETDLIQQVKSVGKEFDVVIEAVGKPQTWEAAINLVRKGGSINFFGGCPTGTVVRFDTARIHYSNLKLLASFHHTPKMIRRALDFIEQGIISARDFVDGECRLGELPKLFQSMAAGNKRIKTAVLVNQ